MANYFWINSFVIVMSLNLTEKIMVDAQILGESVCFNWYWRPFSMYICLPGAERSYKRGIVINFGRLLTVETFFFQIVMIGFRCYDAENSRKLKTRGKSGKYGGFFMARKDHLNFYSTDVVSWVVKVIHIFWRKCNFEITYF